MIILLIFLMAIIILVLWQSEDEDNGDDPFDGMNTFDKTGLFIL